MDLKNVPTKKYRKWSVLAAAVILAIIAIRPMFWLGQIGFLGVIVWLTVALGVLVTYIYQFFKPVPAVVLITVLLVGTIAGGVYLGISAPELNAGEVKTIMRDYYSHIGRAVSVAYQGEGGWKVRILSIRGAEYWYYNEGNGSLSRLSPELTIEPFILPSFGLENPLLPK